MKMKTFRIKTVLAFATAILLGSLESATAQGTFVINGTFDAGGTGWTFSGGSDNYYWDSSKGNPGASVVLDYPATMSQTIYGLTPGVTYAVSGDYKGIFDVAGDGLGVTIDGTSKYFSGYHINWGSFSFTFTADTASTVLSLSSGQNGISDIYRLDNVAITVVPEPSSLCLLGLGGIAGLLFLRRKAAVAF